MTLRTDRRRVLTALVGTGGIALLSSWSPVRWTATRLPAQAALLGVLSELDGARSIGVAYLKAFPSEAGAQTLLPLIAGRQPGALDRHMGRGEARTFLRQAVRQDFHEGHTVELKGWVLSRTEARLCALAALA